MDKGHTDKLLNKIVEKYNTGHAKEDAYRSALEDFFSSVTGLIVVNDPKQSEYGKPDFVFLKKTSSKEKIPIAYAEAKDIDVSLELTEKGEQMGRYYGYSNIILTNGLEFRFYKGGVVYCEPIIIGKLIGGKIEEHEENFKLLEDTLRDFIIEAKEPIKSGLILSKIMAGKARRIRDNINRFLSTDNDENQGLLDIYEVIKKLLISDLDIKKFADMYAQTIVYGLFVARYYDPTNENFTRQEARDLVPTSNPFLRHFFDHITGSSFDKRLEIIVDELCEEFTHADVKAIVNDFYKIDKDDSKDPIIHFYEDFLQEYDPDERKKLGVFYTPLPVVRFIIRAVDDILKKEFGLEKGLSDTSKVEIKSEVQGKKKKETVHRVQILDPATGTGTFLNEIILYLKKQFEGQEGRWSGYVEEDLLPRLHGFEIMMASYTIAHLKLSSTILDTKANIKNNRLGVYLTNSLEKSEKDELNLFTRIGLGKAIAQESREAGRVKNDLPIMVVMGNPPYSISSQNKGDYILDLIKEYKKDLNERRINLDDDYIKFIRFTESIIEKNGEGVVGMITNNSFIDGITHRQMRKHLLETFDSVYILDLHGNSRKKEKTLDGGKDENVFNIMQGVSILLFVKKNNKSKKLGKVFHTDLWGDRKNKFNLLNSSDLESIEWEEVDYDSKYYFFVPKDFKLEEDYNKGFKLNELFDIYNSGVKTDRDPLFIDMIAEDLEDKMKILLSGNIHVDFINNYNVRDSSSYKMLSALKNQIFDQEKIKKYLYRPFDIQNIYYDKALLSRPGYKVALHFLNRKNIALLTSRSIPSSHYFDRVFVTSMISDIHSASDQTYSFPLYKYKNIFPSDNLIGVNLNDHSSNLDDKIVKNIELKIGKTTPEDIFDYIYAILHSPKYRERYKEFLRIDFPRVPYPENKEKFWKLVELGKELRELHLLESNKVNDFITTFSESGDNIVDKKYPKYKDGNVYINDVQYFGNVPEIAWNFYIGGYQPAQKWLKDRKGKKLTNEDIEHYQKIIVVLTETDRLMKEIDEVM